MNKIILALLGLSLSVPVVQAYPQTAFLQRCEMRMGSSGQQYWVGTYRVGQQSFRQFFSFDNYQYCPATLQVDVDRLL